MAKITHDVNISEMVGQTFVKVEHAVDEFLRFQTADGIIYEFYHNQDCCENVSIEDINGDLTDLEMSPLLLAEESESSSYDGADNPAHPPKDKYDDSYTWTFYKFATIKGYVDVRWYGSSNGYYSESVSLRKIQND